MDNRIIYILTFVAGFLVYHFFFKPETETITVETIKETRDTVLVEVIQEPVIIYRDRIQHVYLRDTFIENYQPKINAFRATFPLMYGNAYLSGEVMGELLKTKLETDFKIPVITNTIEKNTTTKTTVYNRGIYAGASTSVTDLYPLISASYIDKSWSFDYMYDIRNKGHFVGIKRKIF